MSGVGSEGLAFTVTGPGTTGPAVGTVSPAQGAAGTEVVIRGTDFGPPEGAEQGTAGVSFNGVAGTSASWSEAEIRVAVPEGATAGPVVVTVGGQVSNGVGFTVAAAGAARPSIVSVSPELGAAGTEVVIRGEHFGDPDVAAQGSRGVSFSGVWAEPSFWSEGEIRVTVPAGATTGPIEVTTPAATAPSASPFTVLRLFLATSQSRVAEPNGTATLTVSVLKAVPSALTVTLDHPGDGNADPATDYRLSQTVVTIGDGGSSATVELTVTDDASYEKDETIEIRASAEGYLDSEEVTVTLESEDPPPLTLTVDPLSRSEREGKREATVTVSVEEPAEGLVRVFLVQQGGHADRNTDYALVDPDTGYALVDPEVWIQPGGHLGNDDARGDRRYRLRGGGDGGIAGQHLRV